MTLPSSSVRPRHRLLAWARKWHAWGGLIAALFLLVVGLTGSLLNYKRPVLTALGLEPRDETRRTLQNVEGPPADDPIVFNTVTGSGAAKVPVSDALASARRHLGEVALDRIELKREADVLVWRIKASDQREVIIDARTGVAVLKGKYEKMSGAGNGGISRRSLDWGRIALDLHTGKIGGEVGKALMTAMALVLVFLSLSGVYLYLKPLWVRRAHVRARLATAVDRGLSTPPTTSNPVIGTVALPDVPTRSS